MNLNITWRDIAIGILSVLAALASWTGRQFMVQIDKQNDQISDMRTELAQTNSTLLVLQREQRNIVLMQNEKSNTQAEVVQLLREDIREIKQIVREIERRR